MSDGAVELRVREALAGVRRGWAYTPLLGKRPRLTDWPGLPRATAAEVEAWARAGNVGVRTGSVSGVVVVDVDSAKGGEIPAALVGIVTPTVETGGGGLHVYFRCPEGGLPNSVGRLAPHVDVRGDGGQVVAVGSIHPDTKRAYAWRAGHAPDDVPLADLPAEIVKALRDEKAKPERARAAATEPRGSPYGVEALRRECADVETAPEGTRNDRLNRAAFNLGQLVATGALGEPDVVRALTDAATRAGLEAGEIAATVASGIAAGRASPRTPRTTPATDERTTDLGNARRLAQREGGRFRYAVGIDWLVWDGRRWAAGDGEIERAAHAVSDSILDEEVPALRALGKTDEANKLWKWGHDSQSVGHLGAMVTLARALDPLRVTTSAFDRNPWLLNVENGTLDLHTGDLRPHRREDLLTKVSPVRYDPKAVAPRWAGFLRDVVPDPEVRAYLQRLAGYCLTGDTGEQAFVVLYGPGGNGKSTFIETLASLVGEYHVATPVETFMASRGAEAGAASPHLAALVGARLVVAVEPPEGARLNEALIKRATGGDSFPVRRLYREPFMFRPAFKLVMVANHQPRISETGDATWRRVHLVPFLERIPDDRRDKSLGATLREEELPGVLNWALAGLAEWRLIGLRPPKAVCDATKAYRASEDVIREFVDDRCVLGRACEVGSTDLYRAYRKWAEESGERPITQTSLGLRLGERSGLVCRKVHGTRRWFGIALRTTPAPGGSDFAGEGGDSSDSLPGLSHARAHEEKSTEEPSTLPTLPPPVDREPGEEG